MPSPFLYIKTVLFQTIQVSISTLFSSIWPIDNTLSGDTTPGQSGPVSDGNGGVSNIPQNYSITGASPSDRFVSYPGHSLGEFYPSAEMQSVYSTASTDWAIGHLLEESYPSEQMQSVYSRASADWVIGHSLEESYSSAQMQSVYFAASADWTPFDVKMTRVNESKRYIEIFYEKWKKINWISPAFDQKWISLCQLQN